MSGAPLPLLGTFHEYSLEVPEVRTALEFYEGLGFTQASTTDAYAHPYAVLTDGRLFIGLHGRGGPSPVLTFVRPGIAQSAPAFADAGIDLTVCRTSDEVFNEIGFNDPSGQAVAVLEARTYSPVDRGATAPSLLGEFAQVSLPAPDFPAAQAYWEALGFVATEEEDAPFPHLPLTSDFLDISLHRPRLCDRPMLVFRDAAMAERIARLRERGHSLAALRGPSNGSALLEATDGTVLLLAPGE